VAEERGYEDDGSASFSVDFDLVRKLTTCRPTHGSNIGIVMKNTPTERLDVFRLLKDASCKF